MTVANGVRVLGCVAALTALTACSSSSSPSSAQATLCHRGVDKSIEVRLDALDTKLPLKVKACIQKQPCVTADAPRNSTLKTSVGFFFTLDDHQQLLQVPVTLDITAGGKTIAHGSVEVPVIQDYVRGPGGKTANCGGRGAITVSATGDVEAVPLRVGR